MKELKNEFKLPKKNFPKLSKMIHYFKSEFSTRTRNESRTKWHNYDKQLLFWVVCKFCQLNSKYIVASLSKKGQKSMDDNDWFEISNILGIDTKILKNKWLVMVKPQVKNAPWSQEEDLILRTLIDPHEKNHNWTQVATQLAELTQNSSFRNAKQIRERWNNYLNPTLKKTEWEESEDVLLLESVLINGKKWSQISQIMGCRTESQVKNRYNSISNRLKKSYGDTYSEEMLVQMEINQLKGYANPAANLQCAPKMLLSPNSQMNIKRETLSPEEMMIYCSKNRPNDLNSSDTLQMNLLRRQQSCMENILTDQQQQFHQSPVYSTQSSPQLSETIFHPHGGSEKISGANQIHDGKRGSSSHHVSHAKNQSPHFPIPPHSFKHQNDGLEGAELSSSAAAASNAYHEQQFAANNYPLYNGQDAPATLPALPQSIGYFYDNYFHPNTHTPLNGNNIDCSSANNILMEDWGFCHTHTPNNNNSTSINNNNNNNNNSTNLSNNTQNQHPYYPVNNNIDFNSAINGYEGIEFVPENRRNSSSFQAEPARHYPYYQSQIFPLPTTPTNSHNNHTYYCEDQY